MSIFEPNLSMQEAETQRIRPGEVIARPVRPVTIERPAVTSFRVGNEIEIIQPPQQDRYIKFKFLIDENINYITFNSGINLKTLLESWLGSNNFSYPQRPDLGLLKSKFTFGVIFEGMKLQVATDGYDINVFSDFLMKYPTLEGSETIKIFDITKVPNEYITNEKTLNVPISGLISEGQNLSLVAIKVQPANQGEKYAVYVTLQIKKVLGYVTNL